MLQWLITWGPHMKHLMRRWESGEPTPALEEAPQVEPHLTMVWEAYTALDRSRSCGMGFPQPIQLSEIEAYTRMIGIRGEALEEVIGVVQYLDSSYLARHAQRAKNKT